MTQPVNTLGRDLKLWFQPESRTFNSQRGVVRDLSGFGRDLEASGGPTVSDDGYRGFGEASFDGSDDGFTFSTISIPDGESFTYAVLFKPEEGGGGGGLIVGSRDFGFGNFFTKEEFSDIRFRDRDGDAIYESPPIEYGQWTLGAVRVSGDTIQVTQSQSAAPTTNVYTSDADLSVDPQLIGFDDGGAGRLTGAISFVGIWSRALSDAEIAQLNRLTAPREARL